MSLDVYLNQQYCGVLVEDSDGQLSFTYDTDFLDTANCPVSQLLPLTDEPIEHARVSPFVANLLPEGDDLRNRLERQLHVDAQHDFGLLSQIGREIAGALSFWPGGEHPPEDPDYQPLDLDQFHHWREFAHGQPLVFEGGTLRLSLAGAQAKTALYFDEEDQPFIPRAGAPTSHIIKPRISGCQPSTVHVELLTMRLAQTVLGEAEVPETDIWENCYRIRRFDRPRSDQSVSRLHQEDFCMALGRRPERKYEGRDEYLLPQCFKLIDTLGERSTIATPALERERLLKQVIFNVLVHNPDAHLKNYGLLYASECSLSVAPLYDALCTRNLEFTDPAAAWDTGRGMDAHTKELSLRIGNARRIDQVSRADWEELARSCGFTAAYVRRLLNRLAEQVDSQLDPAIQAVLNGHPRAETAADELRAAVKAQLGNL